MSLHRRPVRLCLLVVWTASATACSDSAGPAVLGPSYFTATVNGRAWSPTDTSTIQTTLRSDGTFIINAWQGSFPAPPYQSIAIGNVHISGVGSYDFGVSGNGPDAAFIGPLNPGDSYTSFYTDSVHTGNLLILGLDTTAHRVAGHFFFTAVRSDSTVVQVTQGEFRVHYSVFP